MPNGNSKMPIDQTGESTPGSAGGKPVPKRIKDARHAS
jgi:hypothetical protein